VSRSTNRAASQGTNTGPDHTTATVEVKDDERVNVYPALGSTVGEFEFLSELGRGSMGRVYLARQSAPTSRTVVLKVGPYLSSECQKLAKLQHPNIVPVYSFHQWGTMQAVCMPYRGPVTLAHLLSHLRDESLPTLNGRALTTAIDRCRGKRATPDVREAIPSPARPGPVLARVRGLNYVDAVLVIVRQIVEGLRFAHAEGIVHGDLKPANVLIADDGTAQLLDFGVAIDLADRSGTVRIGGTRPYMSPEQLLAFRGATRDFDARSDLYAVGVVLYEMLSGRYPFDYVADSNPNAQDWDYANRFHTPMSVRASNPSVPPAVASIINRCLAAEATDRYQRAAELRDDLDRQLARRPLRYAANPSVSELVGKWLSRHRVAAVVAGGLGLASWGAFAYAERGARN
jgi:serine/threonine protein kinase